MPFAWILGSILLLFALSQIYWFWRARALARKLIRNRTTRIVVELSGLAVFVVVCAFNFGWFGRRPTSIRLTAYNALVEAPFEWWAASSVVAFLIVIILWPVRRAGRAMVSPGRRQFLERTTAAV